jgi:putative protease
MKIEERNRMDQKSIELMAPAGDWDCAKAAVENGADAVYFGLQGGFNARAKAVNFSVAELPELMTFLHSRGVKGYLTLNTLIFPEELEEAEKTVRAAIAAGVDAILIQDLGLLRWIHRLCPEMPLHASTQMTLSSAECIREVESLGVRRVVLPRELPIQEIAAIHRETSLELEVFVHGALCISYSGQCLASLTLGGRSANRGQCAQPCRLPYELICDGQRVDLGEKKYLLSPHDLAAYDRLPQLIAAGVAALKIEGRLKTAEYVACTTAFYRAAIDAVVNADAAVAKANADPSSKPVEDHANEVAEMEMAFSRGFGHGWLDGNDSKSLVSGLSSAKRGICLGKIDAISGQRIRMQLNAPVARGDGVVFEGDRLGNAEQGGRVYEIFQNRQAVEEAASGVVELAFGYDAVDVRKLTPGQTLWKTHDPRLEKRLRKTFSGRPQRSVSVDITVEASVGEPLRIDATTETGGSCHLESPEPLAEAVKHALTEETLRQQLGRLGKTTFQLRKLDARITGQPMIPLSILGKMRHEMIERLEAATSSPPVRVVTSEFSFPQIQKELQKERDDASSTSDTSSPQLHVLCRTVESVATALECGANTITAEFRKPAEYADAISMCRRRFVPCWLAGPRIHRPGENGVLPRLAELEPDGLLVRNLAGLAFCRERKIPAVADFSFNAANALTVSWLHAVGAARITVSYDLQLRQWFDLASTVPPDWLEFVLFRHTPLFHTSHCLFSALQSPGHNRTDCGRPCERHTLRLRDRLGVEHFLSADGQCRNTLFHAEPQNLLGNVPDLVKRGIRHFRLEFLESESPADIERIITTARTRIGIG